MILNAYTLHDLKALNFNQPFFCLNHGVARRMVTDIATDPNTSIGRHPSDYILYFIGTYDDASGVFTPKDIREHVADVITLIPVHPDLFTAAQGAK